MGKIFHIYGFYQKYAFFMSPSKSVKICLRAKICNCHGLYYKTSTLCNLHVTYPKREKYAIFICPLPKKGKPSHL